MENFIINLILIIIFGIDSIYINLIAINFVVEQINNFKHLNLFDEIEVFELTYLYIFNEL